MVNIALYSLDKLTERQLSRARNLRNYLGLSLGIAVVFIWGWRWITDHYLIAGNETNSLPDAFFIVEKGRFEFKLHDKIAFVAGPSIRHYPISLIFIKEVCGVGGDRITWRSNEIYINTQRIGVAKTVNRFGEPMQHTPAGVIPPQHYFVSTPHPDSYDSRYTDVGLVDSSRIVGRVLW